MYKSKPVRNKDGEIIGGYLVGKDTAGGEKIKSGQHGRIAPDRRWFGNTRVISQTELDDFREKVTATKSDPYSVLLRRKKIPMALIKDAADSMKEGNLHVSEEFGTVFGKKSTRKRPNLLNNIHSMEDLVKHVQSSQERGDQMQEGLAKDEGEDKQVKDDMFAKGQSKRIWGELYKVLDCSDVVLQIVDARNVPGTRCYHIEKHIKQHASHKQLITIVNKCDLVPAWCARRWVQILSKDFPTLAFHAAHNNKAFGKGALITLLRQFSKLHSVS
jgi:nuclear GTP-binding protein